MKTLFFASIIIFFASCGKIEIGSGGGWGSGWNFILPPGDSSNIVKATIDSNGKILPLSAAAYSASFYLYYPTSNSHITISAYNENINLQLELINFLNPGIYKFGRNGNLNQEAKASCYLGGGPLFYNDSTLLSGTLKIDTLTAKKITGSFNVKCWNGADSVNIANGIFAGKF